MGNQTDLTLGDMMRHFMDSQEVDVIAVYAEGFKDLDGIQFAEAVREAIRRDKQVIFYKAGRTPEGKTATSGHTASLAGDYMVCETCIRQAGAIMARNFTEFQDLILLAETFTNATIRGKRLGAVSGAGFEAVGMADSLQSDEYSMSLGTYSETTRLAMKRLIASKGLEKLVPIKNPLDINPGADDEVHAYMAELLLNDENIDAVVIGLDPLSPVTHSLAETDIDAFRMDAPDGILTLLSDVRSRTSKPMVAVMDGGEKFEPLRKALRERGIPVFPVCDRAVAALSLYLESRLAAEGLKHASDCLVRKIKESGEGEAAHSKESSSSPSPMVPSAQPSFLSWLSPEPFAYDDGKRRTPCPSRPHSAIRPNCSGNSLVFSRNPTCGSCTQSSPSWSSCKS